MRRCDRDKPAMRRAKCRATTVKVRMWLTLIGRCGQAMREPGRRIIMLVTAGETAEADTVCGNAAAECYRPDAPNFNNRSALCVTIAEQIGGHTLDWWLDGSADRLCGGVVGHQRHASAVG